MTDRKKEFIEMAMSVKDRGVDNLLKYLDEETDFYTAPASTNLHGAYPGGLLDHSLAVLDMAGVLLSAVPEEIVIEEHSIIIASLFHDVCKTNFYVLDEDEPTSPQVNKLRDLAEKVGLDLPTKKQRTKYYFSKCIEALMKGDKAYPEFSYSYKVKDVFPYGHGEKSVYIIQECMALKVEEALAIRWHLGGFDPGTAFGFPSGFAQKQACREYPLVSLLAAADMAATYLIDIW